MSTEERVKRNKEGTEAAIWAGARSGAIAVSVCAGIHIVGTAFVPPYQRLNAYVKRIGSAIAIIGAYSVGSQIEAAHIVERQYQDQADAMQTRDKQRLEEITAANAAIGAARRRAEAQKAKATSEASEPMR
jgi:alanyl-tRNA synthetase